MITLDFCLQWGQMYEINSFNIPSEQIMYLGRSKGFIICCSESGLHTDWLIKGFAIEIPSAMAEHVYMVPESVFYPKDKGQYPEQLYLASNFETIDAMISMNLIHSSEMKPSMSYLWNLNESSNEIIAYKWFMRKMLSVSDFKISEKNLRVCLKIAENMMKRAGIKRRVIEIYIMYMAIMGSNMVYNGEQRFESIRQFQVNQLPF